MKLVKLTLINKKPIWLYIYKIKAINEYVEDCNPQWKGMTEVVLEGDNCFVIVKEKPEEVVKLIQECSKNTYR